MGAFTVRLTQTDIDYPDGFIYFVYFDDVFVVSFEHLDEANAFIIGNGGDPVQVIVPVKGVQATAGSIYR